MIAKEGIPFIACGLVLAGMFLWLALRGNSLLLLGSTILLAALTCFVTFFFRDPDRSTENDSAHGVLAPADGRIVEVREAVFPDGQPAKKVSIFLSVFDVHINRMPISGIVKEVQYVPGAFLVASRDKASTDNERTEILLETSDGRQVLVKQIAGLIARRIVCRVKPGDRVERGARFGLIRFGSRTEIFLPVDTKINVRLGDHVYGGQTVLAELAAQTSGSAKRHPHDQQTQDQL